VLVTYEQGDTSVVLLVCSPGKFGFHQATGQKCCIVVPTDPVANGWVSLKARPGMLQVYHTQIPNGSVSVSLHWFVADDRRSEI
jgi:hypothetical protein